MNEEDTVPESEPVENEVPRFLIPDCCREGWEDCPHVVNRAKEYVRGNVGL